ncbi:MAG TPA: hypothetical protein VFN11_14140 [Ktedonobacterales bacterium]|nr:hypothetical protein [Ktedonobacterales bacterium]
MITPPAATPPPYSMSAPQPAPSPRSSRPSLFGIIFGIVATVLTVGAIALAVFAPQLTTAPNLRVPQGWQHVYNDNPGTSSGLWDSTGGCDFSSEGLHIASEGTCTFKPADSTTLTNGLLVVARLAPAADVATSEDTGILLDNSVLVIVSQQGDYKICRGTCQFSSSTGEGPISGSTIAMHSDAFVANEIAVLYNADASSIDFYINGQFVNHATVDISGTPSIALATSSSGETLVTHVDIYAGGVS